MFEKFNLYKAEQFLLKTNQCPFIIQAVRGLRPYDEIEILDMIENKKPCEYYAVEKLYCIIMQEMNYDVPFTLEELLYNIKMYPRMSYRKYNKSAFEYVQALKERLCQLYPI